jgi:CCR4-NOT transcription complex subunit 6
MCYNILAEIYTTRTLYPYCPLWALAWCVLGVPSRACALSSSLARARTVRDYRKHVLLREILSHKAELIALQEIQADHFETFFNPALNAHGYAFAHAWWGRADRP